MGISIYIHSKTVEDSMKTRDELLRKLELYFPGRVFSHYNNSLMVIDRRIHIDFRCGDDFSKLAGIHPDYYYTDTDSVYISTMFEQGAAKVNGRVLHDIDQVITICANFIGLFDRMDEYLKYCEEKEK